MLTERLWERIKAAALRNAAEGFRPSLQDSERIVNGIVLSLAASIPRAAFEFYTRELIQLTGEAENAQKKTRAQ